MGKKSKETISARRLKILEEIYRSKGGITLVTLVDIIAEKFGQISKQTVQKDLDDLISEGFPIQIDGIKVWVPVVGMQDTWVGTIIGNRLLKSEQKRKLAKATFIFVKKNKKSIKEIIAGTGSTVYECIHELLDRENELEPMRIHTANLLVLHCSIYHKSKKFVVEVANGELDLDRAALTGEHIADYFAGLENINAVITGFSDMSFEKGFYTEFLDKNSKLADLRPKSKKCKWIIIPIEWSKITTSVGTPVAKNREEQLDFADGNRKYIIITNKPSDEEWESEVDDPRLADLEKWKETYPDSVEIIYA